VTEAAEQQPSISGPQYLRLIGLGALIGIPAALLAAVFLALIHLVEDWLWHDLPDALGYDAPPWFLVLLLPVVGAGLVLAARRARVTKIILPAQNRRDLDDVPKEPFKDIRFIFVDNMRQVFREALKEKAPPALTTSARPARLPQAASSRRSF